MAALKRGLESMNVLGATSGAHTVVLAPHSDGRGASFVPDFPFQAGELVSVTGLGFHRDFKFTVSRPIVEPTATGQRVVKFDAKTDHSYYSRPDLKPPRIKVTPNAKTAPGYVFLGVKNTAGQYGTMIADNKGEPIWFQAISANTEVQATDVKVQHYQGQPVLTWWEGFAPAGHGNGHYVIADTSYKTVATVQAGNGYNGADLHEFMITPQGTALFFVYQAISWDTSSVGGGKDGSVYDGLVQEVDIKSGRVLFEWHGLDHIALTEAYNEFSKDEPFDFLHPNSIDVAGDGDLIVSARHTCALYKIDRVTSDIVWRLNGKKSDFKVAKDAQIAWQHDARVQPNGHISVYDDGWDGKSTSVKHEQSRGVDLEVDTKNMKVTLAREYTHPDGILSPREGNMQVLPNGNVFIGWGKPPTFSEFSSKGDLVFDGNFLPADCESYRAFRFPWTGKPADLPSVAVLPGRGGELTVYVSWNGATEVATWEVLAGTGPSDLSTVKSTPRSGFETAISVRTSQPYLAVQAKSQAGTILATSKALKLPS